MTKYCHITGATAYHYIYSNVEVRPLLRLTKMAKIAHNILILLDKHTVAACVELVWKFKTFSPVLKQGKKQTFKLGYIVLASTVKTAWQGLKCVLKGF